MLPGTGVTGNQPFTDKTLNRVALYQGLHRLVKRANVRVKLSDRAAVDAALRDASVDVNAVLDYTQPVTCAKTLERMLRVMVNAAPYVTQAYDRKNAPFGADKKAVLKGMVDEAASVFTTVADGNHDALITATFTTTDAGQLGTVRDTFTQAVAALKGLYDKDLLIADHRGDLEIQGAGALTSPASMLLPPTFADARTDHGLRLLLHESFHAVSARIVDHVYASDPSFAELPFVQQITNADHFAFVARAFARLEPPLPAPVAVQGVGVVLAPTDTAKVRNAVSILSHRLTRAWVRALWSLQTLSRLPYFTDINDASELYELSARQLQMNSLTCGLTLHHRSDGGRCSAEKPAAFPFPAPTPYDVAVLEEIVADLHALVGWVHGVATVDVIASAAVPTPGKVWLRDTDLLQATDDTGRASLLLDQAVAALANPWFAQPADTKRVVEQLRIRDSV